MDEMVTKNTNIIIPFHPEKRKDDGHEITKQIWFSLQAVREKKDIHLDERWFYVKESKTDAGIREVPIAEKIVPFFEYWMNRNCDHLICTPDDKPFEYRNYYDSYWKPMMQELSLAKYTPHCTRHLKQCYYFVSNLLLTDRNSEKWTKRKIPQIQGFP